MSSGRSWTGSAFLPRVSARITRRSADTDSPTPRRFAPLTAPQSGGVRSVLSPEPIPFSTRRYGVSMNPNSLIRAYVESDEISPMFGPSGVSIGQVGPQGGGGG